MWNLYFNLFNSREFLNFSSSWDKKMTKLIISLKIEELKINMIINEILNQNLSMLNEM